MADLCLLTLSGSFAELWPDLAEECGLELVEFESLKKETAPPVATIVAAGGEERKALDVLGDMDAPGCPVYVVGAETSHRFATEAIKRGGSDYFSLPSDLDLLRRTVRERAESAERGGFSSGSHRAQPQAFESLIGKSPTILETLDRARRVAPHSDVSVLVLGETGTGKEVLSRAIHEAGPRAGAPFVAVNCAAIPDNLLESELFGHEKGAFTGAGTAKQGLFEEADTGSIFLDEIGHLPLPLQGKILRVLEEKTVRRVGSTRDRKLDIKIIAATHVDLASAVSAGEFREDLFYRLNVVSLTLPPVRERGKDVLLLAEKFLTALSSQYGIACPALSADVKLALQQYDWPGNVRELRHSIERALLLSPPGTLDISELVRDGGPVKPENGSNESGTLSEIMKHAAVTAVTQAGGNKSAAARALAISRARLQRLLDGGEDE